MDDLIGRRGAIEEAINAAWMAGDHSIEMRDALRDALMLLPSAEKRGKWIYPTDIIGFGRCGNCKALWDIGLIRNKFFRYCPRCGAKMEEEES